MTTIENVRNPVWANTEQTTLNCEIKHSLYGWIPFTASEADSEQHGRRIHAEILTGQFGAIGEFVPPPEPVANPKLQGVEFEGVMCSATGTDQNGVNAIMNSYLLSPEAFKEARMKFENGNVLVLSKNNIQAFYSIWWSFRQSFFQNQCESTPFEQQ